MENLTGWHSKSLGDGMWAPTVTAQIEAIFAPLFVAAGKSAKMAVFTRREEGRLHCEVSAYFSPAAQDVASAFDAEICAKPLRTGLDLLAGSQACWPELFPEEK